MMSYLSVSYIVVPFSQTLGIQYEMGISLARFYWILVRWVLSISNPRRYLHYIFFNRNNKIVKYLNLHI